MQVSCHNASKKSRIKLCISPHRHLHLPSWITTTTPPKQTPSLSFNESITNLEARSREVNGDTQLIIPRPVKRALGSHYGCQTRGSRPHQTMLKGRLPLHPIRARESNPPTEQSERANQRASIAKRLPPLHSHTTPFDDGQCQIRPRNIEPAARY